MDLDIEIIPLVKFDVKIKGKSIGRFENKSSWEGFVKLQNNKVTIIVADEKNLIDKIFNNILQTEKQSTYYVVNISHGLLPKDSKTCN